MAGSLARAQSIGLDTGPAFVFGYDFSDRGASALDWSAAQAPMPSGAQWRWLHLNIYNEDARRWLRDGAGLPLPAVSTLLAEETRPRVTPLGDGFAVNLRGVNLNEGAEPEDMVSVRIWIEQSRVISVRLRKLRAAVDVRDQIEAGRIPDNPGALVANIAHRLAERTHPFIQEIEDEVDGLEDALVTGEGRHLRSQLADTRHDAVLLRRFIAPQRDALTRLAADECALFDTSARISLRETADLVTRHTESLDAARERAMVLQDQLADRRAEEMNRNMMILSVAAAIFLPLGFLTGLFGVNVGGMPGMDSPIAFWVIVAACCVIGGVLALLFKFLDWL